MGSTFNGTPFNDEQLAHMRSIAKLPPEQVSWCGWGRAGDPHCCADPDCAGKKAGKTAADKLALRCLECNSTPWSPEGKLYHRISCSRRETTPGNCKDGDRG